MKSTICILIFIIIASIIAQNSVQSILIQNDYDQLLKIMNKINFDSSNITRENICTNSLVFCSVHADGYNMSLFSVKLWSDGTKSLQVSDFKGLKSLEQLVLKDVYIGNSFITLLNQEMPKLQKFDCDNCGVSNLQSGLRFQFLTLTNNDFTGVQYLKSLTWVYDFNCTKNKYKDVEWINNLDGPDMKTSIKVLTLESLSFPNLTHFSSFTNITIYPSENFNSFANINKMPNAERLMFISDTAFPKILQFPKYLAKNPYSNWYFYSVNINWNILQVLDFSAIKLLSFKIEQGTLTVNNDYNIFPISRSSPVLADLNLKKGNYKKIAMNAVRKVTRNDLSGNQFSSGLPENITFYENDRFAWTYDFYQPSGDIFRAGINLRNNSFTGTIPSWFCNVDVQFANNKFTGELPPCFGCFLNDTNVRNRIANNSFSNYNDSMTQQDYPVCGNDTIRVDKFVVSTLVPNKSRFPGAERILYMHGTNFGVHSKITLKSETSILLNFAPIKHNEIYGAPLTLETISKFNAEPNITIHFVVPNLVMNFPTKGLFDVIYKDLIIPFPKDPNPEPTTDPNTSSSSSEIDSETPNTSTTTTSTYSSTTGVPSSSSDDELIPNNSIQTSTPSSFFIITIAFIFTLLSII